MGEDRVERRGELPGLVADQEREVGRPVTEVHEEIADLSGGPWSVGVGGDSEDVAGTGVDLDEKEAVQAPRCHGADHDESTIFRRSFHATRTRRTTPQHQQVPRSVTV